TPGGAVARLLDGGLGKLVVGGLELLQRHHVGLLGAQPIQEIGQPLVDVVDVEGRDLHGKGFWQVAAAFWAIFSTVFGTSSSLARFDPCLRANGEIRWPNDPRQQARSRPTSCCGIEAAPRPLHSSNTRRCRDASAVPRQAARRLRVGTRLEATVAL